jgi:Family of unknown function (DUF6519)
MYGDFSRLTFNRAKSYSAAWSQQGRMQLDADFNEQTAILLDWMRTLATDFMGPAGGSAETAGFAVTIDGSGGLSLTAGHYYVAGIRCEIFPPGPDGNPEPPTHSPGGALGIPSTGTYLVCLTVWERSVSGLQDPTLLEPALGPTTPDTTIRSQVVWAPVVLSDPKIWTDSTNTEVDYEYVDRLFLTMNNPSQPTLNATPTQGYSGLENQLYRIEIHSGNADNPNATPTFKWSRDNGSVEFGIDQTPRANESDSSVIHLTGAGLPGRPKLEVLDCVEVIDSSWVPFGSPGRLYSVVTGVDPIENTVTLDQAVDTGTPVLLRRWDSVPIAGDGTPVPDDGSPVPIENGIEVVFDASAGATYQRGDFWLIPARAATGQIYGPTTDDNGAPPYGPQRHYAPLAQVNPDGGGAKHVVYDLRSLFTQLAWPLAEQKP